MHNEEEEERNGAENSRWRGRRGEEERGAADIMGRVCPPDRLTDLYVLLLRGVGPAAAAVRLSVVAVVVAG